MAVKFSRLKYTLVFAGIVLLLLFTADWLTGVFLFKPGTSYFTIRQYLQNEKRAGQYLAQPFLNYSNNPLSITDSGEHQINTAGIRHTGEVAIPKPIGTLRILFLGGSTTFGEVAKTEDVFPALLQKIMEDSLPQLNLSFTQVECLNAGLGAATSAELLVQYLLKFKYFDPDVVVIHSGINDAFCSTKMEHYTYQPDYHTSKRVMENLPEVTPAMQLLSHSNMASLFMCYSHFKRQLKSDLVQNDFFDYHAQNLWYPAGNDSMYVPRCNAYYNNLTELVKSITAAGKPAMLVTEITDTTKMATELKTMLTQGIEKDNAFTLQIGQELNVPVCALNKNDFPPNDFIPDDGIHLNELGEKQKAAKIAPQLLELLKKLK